MRFEPKQMSQHDQPENLESTDDSTIPSKEPEKKSPAPVTPLTIIGLLCICAVLAAILVPSFMAARAGGHFTHCNSNLKNIGSAMEMYSTDFSGKYPPNMALLTPNYLKSIPECGAAGSVTYVATFGTSVAYNTNGFNDYYFIQCQGDHHGRASVPANYPQYDAIQGLIEQ